MPIPRGQHSEALEEIKGDLRTIREAEMPEQEIPESTQDTQEPEPEEIEVEAEETGEALDVEGGEANIELLNDLAEQLGWEPGELYSLKKKVDKGNGESTEISVGEAFDTVLAARAEREELAQQRAQLKEQTTQLQQQAAQAAQYGGEVSREAESARARIQFLEDQYPILQQDWARREQDPAQVGQVANERQKIQEQYMQAQGAYKKAAEQAQVQQQQAYQQWLAEQANILQEKIPELRDAAKASEIGAKVRQTAADYGFSQEEIGRLDARAFMLLRDAQAGRDAKAGATAALKATKANPRVVPKGMRLSRGKGKAAERAAEQARDRALETGRRSDQVAAARALFDSLT